MNEIRYDQIICCSSEKSAVTGMPGFGVRAKSNGLTNGQADEIYLKSGLRYALPTAKMVTAEILRQTPQLDTIYPHIYAYKQIQLSNGSTRYLIARMMYVGAEYGFFEDSEFNNRVGSNYIGHILVFNENPTMCVVAELLLQNKFLPVNTLCTFSNIEFSRILKGDSFELPIGELSLSGHIPVKYTLAQCHLLVAMLQAYKNKLDNSEITDIIAKINSSAVENTIISMGAMPQVLTNSLFFNANMMDQSCVPLGMSLIISNEKDDVETLDKYHIVINALGDKIERNNIGANYLFDKIKELSTTGDVNRINTVAQLYLNLCNKPEPNYEKAYQLVTLATTDEILSLTDATSLDIEMIEHLPFTDSEKELIWDKINYALKESFTYPGKLQEIKNALDLIEQLLGSTPHRLKYSNEYAKALKHILFVTNENFKKLLEDNHNRISVVLSLFEKEGLELPSEDSFYKSLLTTNDVDVWNTFMLYYYKERSNIVEHMQIIVGKIMESGNEELATKLFPIADHLSQWMQIINDCPQYAACVNEEVCDLLCGIIKNSPQKVLDEVLSINNEALRYLDMQRITNEYADTIACSGKVEHATVDNTRQRLSALGIESNQIDRILDILNEKEISHPTYKDLQIALRQETTQSYILALFKKWLLENASLDDLAMFVSEYSKNADSAALLIDIIWSCSSKQDRNAKLVKIYDRIDFKRFKKSDVIELLSDKEARDLLSKENTIFRKLFRSVFGARLILLCLLELSLFTSCDLSHTDYVTPFAATHLGDSIGVYQVSIYDYNAKGTLMNIYTRCYTPDGKLCLTTQYNRKGGIDSVVYHYNSDGKLTSIRERGIENNDLVYNGKHQLSQYTKKTHLENANPIHEKYNFTYNTDNTLKEIVATSGNGEEIQHKEFFYDSGKLSSIKDLRNSSLQEISFNPDDGTISSVCIYSHPQGKLQVVRNYNYEEVQSQDDTLCTQIIKITNSKGRYQGRLKKSIVTFNHHFINGYNAALNDTASMGDVDIVNIPPPKVTGNFFTDYINNIKYRINVNKAKISSPGMWLLCIVLFITCVCIFFYFKIALDHSCFRPFTGKPNAWGMKKMWMFNSGPYINVSLFLLIIICAFVTAVLFLLAFGIVTYGFLWLLKFLIIALVWVGFISLGGGLLILFGSQDKVGCLPIILGGLVVKFEDNLRSFGEDIVDWGFLFMKKVNVFEWGLSLFVDFGDVIISVCAIPMLLFIAITFAVIFIILLLMGVEWVIMKIYGINRPCPVCGSKKTKEYWIDEMHKYPIKLHPGVYGVFSQTYPLTSTKMPTMLMFGKSKLLRKCNDCGNFITSEASKSYGTEKHIGLVGHRSSGKSYLTYTILDKIMKNYGSSAHQIDIDPDTKIESNVLRIKNNQGIQTDDRASYRAIQLIIKPKWRPIPYHLFFYDVAGEKFNFKSSSSKTAMDFYKNVNQILFIVDPTTIDFSHTVISDKMQEWLKSNASNERYSIEGIFSTLQSILDNVGRKSKDIYFMFVLAKADNGFLSHCGKKADMTNDEIKQFMQSELGLTNIINAASGAFRKVEFGIASVKDEYNSQVSRIIDDIFNNLKV